MRSTVSRGMAVFTAVLLVGAVALTGCSKKNAGTGAGGGKKITVAFVPKLQGIPYFEAMNTGGKKAAAALGVNWIYKGATTADPGAQTDIVKSLIQQKVDVLVVAPNDPDSLAPVLQDAKNAGIHVMTSDTDAPNSIREVFVNQATAEGIGMSLTDNLVKAMGGKGEYAIVSCGQTAANLNSWIAVQKSYGAQKYPNVKLDGIVYAGEDQAKSVTMAKQLMAAHPTLTGLVGECTASAPGVAQAVRESGKIGKVFTVGLGTPQSMKPFLQDGSSSSAILWDVENLGYLTVWAAKQVADKKSFAATNNVSGALPAVKYFADKKMLLLGDPLVITKANADKYNY
ncbi:autoinducer 2 ABC transporter substrate-binding protein [Fodinicola acaciae]|uniref:autoinducer 2 ABC transporter substrate-binding protein n=1 Tax=Fodinicola acaciae TaxID=2681555 RepID=UPI0013D2775A|nr:autoinducer 2 ABC transporter substrate-binding protein [Fodinicola acaciae]